MRILHLSDDRLPDWRIEKSALSASNLGYEVIFAGTASETYRTNTFSRKYEINWTERSRRGIPFYWQSVKKQVERTIRETRPDIVHAHNIFSAKMISEFRLPFVYDDHEYWSEFSKILAQANEKVTKRLSGGLPRKALRKLTRNILNRRAMHLWTNWEKEIVSSNPTITVSDKIAEELSVSEVNDFEQPRAHTNLSSVYAGIESAEKPVNRDIDGLNDAFGRRDIGQLTIIGAEGKSPKEKR